MNYETKELVRRLHTGWVDKRIDDLRGKLWIKQLLNGYRIGIVMEAKQNAAIDKCYNVFIYNVQ